MPSRKRTTRKPIRAPHSAIRISQKRGLGWIPDRPDQRDFLYAAPPAFLRALPPRVDLRRECPPVYDQGQLGSCTANAIGGAIEFDQIKERLPQVFIPSRLFIYYNERVLEGSVASDAGAMLRDGIKTVAKQGACPEPLWPYVVSKFKLKPPVSCYTEAAKHTAVTYQRLTRPPFTRANRIISGWKPEPISGSGMTTCPRRIISRPPTISSLS